jgi:hypothetical protein
MIRSLLRRALRPKGIPPESLLVIQAVTDGLPDIWIVNRALGGFAPRAELAWHLSVIIQMAEPTAAGMPAPAEQEVLGALGEELRRKLLADENAAFLASITWNGTRQLVFRVRDPERADAYLKTRVDDPSPVRQMEYRMEEDPAWALAAPHLQHVR